MIRYSILGLLLIAQWTYGFERKHPNILVMMADDLGIGDLGCYGNDSIKTPNIDRLASEGLKLNHHLSAEALCTPSRAAFLTARYPARYGLVGEKGTTSVIPHVANGAKLPEEEITLAEALLESNYATALVGKWHLGSGCDLVSRKCHGPKRQGFQYFFGLPLTLLEEMEGDHPFWTSTDEFQDYFKIGLIVTYLITAGMTIMREKNSPIFLSFLLLVETVFLILGLLFLTHFHFHTPVWWRISAWLRQRVDGIVVDDGGDLVYTRIPFEGFSQELISKSINFMNSASRNDKPFFLLHSFAHVHTPMFTSRENKGRSAFGRYGDNVEELDEGVGALMQALIDNKIAEDTIVYFVSDHGAHLEAIHSQTGERTGGHNKEYKGGKGQGAAEGGIRVPGILRWPNYIAANSSLDYPISLLDMMPTLLHLAHLQSIENIFENSNELDGQNMGEVILNRKMPNAKRVLLHHCGSAIHAMRLPQDDKVYKMHLSVYNYPENSTQCGWGNKYCDCYSDVIDVLHQPHLYELNSDPFENQRIDPSSQEYREIVAELLDYLHKWQERVVYPPSQYRSMWNTAFLPWLQPL